MSSDSLEQQQQQRLRTRLGVVTIHDACPAFSTKIFELADELERLNIKFNIALIPFFSEKQDLPRFPEFVDKIKSYKKNCQIVLHGLYHEKKNGQFDDFHRTKEADAEEQIRAGLEIFHEIGINTNVFIPPAWKLNNSTIKVLEKLGFKLAEEQEEYLLLLLSQQQQHHEFKKIKLPKVLNWDSTGYPEKNIVNMARDERAFKLQIKEKPQIIRIALHPRDPVEAIKDQKQIISILKDSAYEIPTYAELLPKLEEL